MGQLRRLKKSVTIHHGPAPAPYSPAYNQAVSRVPGSSDPQLSTFLGVHRCGHGYGVAFVERRPDNGPEDPSGRLLAAARTLGALGAAFAALGVANPDAGSAWAISAALFAGAFIAWVAGMLKAD